MAEGETTRDDDGLEAVVEAVWDALDAKHDDAYHVHAAECCWAFRGSTEAIRDVIRARLAAPDHRADNELRERVQALAASESECWVTRSPLNCTAFIGGTFPGGGEWTEPMCCLPCRLRALLDEDKP